MIKRFFINIAIGVLFGGGSWVLKSCELNKTIDAWEADKKAFSDTISTQRVTMEMLTNDVFQLRQLDSSNKFFIVEKEKVIKQMRDISRNDKAKIAELEAWKEDAMDGIIIQLDTIKVKRKGLFGLGNGWKPIKN